MTAAAFIEFAMGSGGCVVRGAVRVPAGKLVPFLEAAEAASVPVQYVESLFLLGHTTRPSMEFSRERQDFASFDLFVAFARDAAARALDQAQTEGSEAVFEVWP